MLNVQNLAPGVDTMLLNKILVVTIPTHFVDVTPSNYSLSPSTMRWMRWVSVLYGPISATMRPYVTILPFGGFTLGMNKIVLFPFGMRVPTPWACLPRSFSNAFTHISESGPCRNLLYSCNIPVVVLITSLASNLLNVLCAVRICVARAVIFGGVLESRGSL